MKTKINTINLATDKIVKVAVIDHDWDDPSSAPGGVLDTYFFVNPDKKKLNEFKKMIEERFDRCDDENLSEEELEQAQRFCDAIWEEIEKFIDENFISLEIAEVFEISY